MASYNKSKKPIEISFMNIISNIKPDRATHLIHSYPAKLLVQIPFFFLNNNIFSKEGDTVLDPFCGSGTVLLESILAKRNALGADPNPLARLISTVKTQKFRYSVLIRNRNILIDAINQNSPHGVNEIRGMDFWFNEKTKKQLVTILNSIGKITNPKYRNFFYLCFSNCLRKVSLADPKISVPVKLREDKYPVGHPLRKRIKDRLKSLENCDVKTIFFQIVDENINRIKKFNLIKPKDVHAQIISSDARRLKYEFVNNKHEMIVPKESVDLILTSPPYAGAQKYVRASKINLSWLNMARGNQLNLIDKKTIGRENYRKYEYNNYAETGIKAADKFLKEIHKLNPIRAHIASNYLLEMKDAFKEITRILKPGGYFILIIGNNHICNREFKTHSYLTTMLRSMGLSVVLRLLDEIKSYGLMTKRNKTASIITREWVLIFRK